MSEESFMFDLKFIDLDFSDTENIRKSIKHLFRKYKLDADTAVNRQLCDKFFIQTKIEAIQNNDERTYDTSLYVETLFLERVRKIYRAISGGHQMARPQKSTLVRQPKYIFLLFFIVVIISAYLCVPTKKIFIGGSAPHLDADVESDFDFMAG